jgi:predicted esterase
VSSPEIEARVEHIVVQRTARYIRFGAPSPETKELWIALHGYGQLAADFARALSPVLGERRVVVVPEALSRFYLESPTRESARPTQGRQHLTARVGATWMTREDREAEIVDQVSYLDRLLEHLLGQTVPSTPRVHVLGFSQGVATAARWLARGRAHVHAVSLWCGQFPDDVDATMLISSAHDTRVTFVTGNRDIVIPAEGIARTESKLSMLGDAYTRLTFDGGHRLDRGVLTRLLARL